ncbi:MAG: DUF4357 domain-containing protein [Nocardioides sp.]
MISTWTEEKNTHSVSTRKAYASYRARHQQLVADASIAVRDGGTGEVSRDIPFSSPSAAGAVILGRACNGRKEWVGPDGQTFGQWESLGIE